MVKDNNHQERIPRRKLLKAMVVPAAGLVAGCSGDGGSGGGTPSDGGSTPQPTSASNETPSLEERAQEEGAINAATSMSNSSEYFKQIMAEDLGLSVSYSFRDAGKLATQLVEEHSAGRVSVDMSAATSGSPITHMELAEEGISRPLPEHLLNDDTLSFDPIGKVDGKPHLAHTGTGKALVPLYNTNNVSDPPTNLDELFSEKWRGKITVDVRDSELVPAARRSFDSDQRAREFIRNLGEYGTPMSSHFDAAKQIARGEYPIGITYAKYTRYDWGGPLGELDIPDFVRTANILIMKLISDAPHPNAAELGLRYSLKSTEGDPAGSRIAKFAKENYGDDIYYTLPELKDTDLNLFVASPEVMATIDTEEVEETWTELTGFE